MSSLPNPKQKKKTNLRSDVNVNEEEIQVLGGVSFEFVVSRCEEITTKRDFTVTIHCIVVCFSVKVVQSLYRPRPNREVARF